MARYYYAITSTKRLQEEKSVNGYKTVKIKGVTKIEENGPGHNYLSRRVVIKHLRPLLLAAARSVIYMDPDHSQWLPGLD